MSYGDYYNMWDAIAIDDEIARQDKQNYYSHDYTKDSQLYLNSNNYDNNNDSWDN